MRVQDSIVGGGDSDRYQEKRDLILPDPVIGVALSGWDACRKQQGGDERGVVFAE